MAPCLNLIHTCGLSNSWNHLQEISSWVGKPCMPSSETTRGSARWKNQNRILFQPGQACTELLGLNYLHDKKDWFDCWARFFSSSKLNFPHLFSLESLGRRRLFGFEHSNSRKAVGGWYFIIIISFSAYFLKIPLFPQQRQHYGYFLSDYYYNAMRLKMLSLFRIKY